MLSTKDKIELIRVARMSPEQRFIYDTISKLVKYKHIREDNSVFYKLNDDVIFEHNKNGFWVDKFKFSDILCSLVGIVENSPKQKQLIKFMVEKYMGMKNVNPHVIGLTLLYENDKLMFHKINL